MASRRSNRDQASPSRSPCKSTTYGSPTAKRWDTTGNPYELAVDPYGTVWQTDSDDDGNRSTRLNYVMEGGNFGYRDEMTGAGWRTPRIGMSAEIPRQHWHSDDPGSVPNVRINGAGSPSGLTVYEGSLLPARFRGMLLHADAGTAEVRAYPVRADGAGYASEVVPIVSSTRDRMFRPVDVATAPDGSIMIADWYDAGVGGHNMSDQSQGRIFRIAPPGVRYTVPALDLSTPAGAARALASPNLATRYLAYQKLHELGAGAEDVLAGMYRSADQGHRARALWLLATIPDRGMRHIGLAARDTNPDIRIVALRAARRIGADVIPIAEQLAHDPSPAVRREVALSLRHNTSPRAAVLWAELAGQHDASDRWSLEALGVAADRQWDRFFGAWLDKTPDPLATAAARDIVWRSRSARALPLLERLASDNAVPASERLRYFRALEFHDASGRQSALLAILAKLPESSTDLVPAILERLDATSAKGNAVVQRALARTLAWTRGTTQFVQLVEKYDARDWQEELIRFALAKPNETTGAESARLALAWGGTPRFAALVAGRDESASRRALTVLGRNFTPAVDSVVVGVVMDRRRPVRLRQWAVQSMGNGQAGTQRLLRLVQSNGLPEDMKSAAASVLFSSNAAVRDSAAKHLTPPSATTLDGKTLPPLMTLAARTGDPADGRIVFQRTCTSCHVAQGNGIDFGPGLTRDRRQTAEGWPVHGHSRSERGSGVWLRGLRGAHARRPAARGLHRQRDGQRARAEDGRRHRTPCPEAQYCGAQADGWITDAEGTRARTHRSAARESRRVSLHAASGSVRRSFHSLELFLEHVDCSTSESGESAGSHYTMMSAIHSHPDVTSWCAPSHPFVSRLPSAAWQQGQQSQVHRSLRHPVPAPAPSTGSSISSTETGTCSTWTLRQSAWRGIG
ncbi:MAG: PVC-type heme-binding CxxCH protein [bacterium]